MKIWGFFVVLLSLVALAMASENAAGPYPEHGKVVAVRTETSTGVRRPYVVNGRLYGGQSYSDWWLVYKVETTDRAYEFTGSRRQDFRAGEEIRFRVSGGKAYMPSVRKGKEAWYVVSAVELRR